MGYQKELDLLRRVVPTLFQETENQTKSLSYKNKTELVTSSDLFIESEIIKAVLKEFPNDRFLSEEFHKSERLGDRTWVIDPIDGTSNYAHSLDVFVVQIALFDKGEVVLSYIHAPRVNKTYHAILGEGAFLNDHPIHVLADQGQPVRLMSMIGISHDTGKDKNKFLKLIEFANRNGIKARMLGSLGFEMAAMAEGSFALLYTDVSNPWDIAPGLLLIREAGGFVVNEEGRPYHMGDNSLYAFCDEALQKKTLQEAK